MSRDVTDAASADKDGLIQPPIFVRYENGGVVAFEDVEQALRKVSVTHIPIITGAWDRTGLPMRYEVLAGRLVLAITSTDCDFLGLRGILLERLGTEHGEVSGDSQDDELVQDAFKVLRLKGKFELFSEEMTSQVLGGLSYPGG